MSVVWTSPFPQSTQLRVPVLDNEEEVPTPLGNAWFHKMSTALSCLPVITMDVRVMRFIHDVQYSHELLGQDED